MNFSFKQQILSWGLFLPAFILLLSIHVSANPHKHFYVSGRYDINTGLSSNYLQGVFQDQEGYLWIATDNGINRFDGYNTLVYKPDFFSENSFNSITFSAITEDKDKRLWFGTARSGINIFDKSTQKVTILDRTGKNALQENTINYLFCDSRGRIWIATIGGLDMYEPEQDKIINFGIGERSGKSDPFGTISYVYEDSNGRILVGTWGNGLYVYEEDSDTFTQMLVNLVNDSINRIHRITEDKLGNYWLGTWEGGLVKARIHNYRHLEVLSHFSMQSPTGKALSSNIIYSVFEQKNGSIWVGTPYGLNVIQNPHTSDPTVILIQSGEEPGSISHDDILDIYEDRSGIIWISTGGGGLNKINPDFQRIESYTIQEMVKQHRSQNIRSFIIDDDGSLLIGVHGLGFGKYNLDDKKFTPYTQLPRFSQLPAEINAATCFHKDSKGNLWIGTRYNALFVIRPDGKPMGHYLNWDPVTTDRSRNINMIFEDQFGNMWVATSNGLFKLVPSVNNEDYDIFRFIPQHDNPHSLQGEFISSVFEDADANIWVGSVGGGLSYGQNSADQHSSMRFNHFSVNKENPQSIRSNIIYAIYQDKNKRIWIGTGTAGLALYEPQSGKFKHFLHDAGFREDAVYDIIEVADNLWLTSNKGMYRFGYHPEGNHQIELFTSEDGFQSDVFINNASFKTDDERIFVGGYYGFNVFRPTDLFRNRYIPPVVISGIWVDNEMTNVYEVMKNGLTLRHNQNNIRVAVSSLSFFQPMKNKYSYMIKGLDEDWNFTDIEGRILNYSHIPPGSYTLMVKGSNSSDLWNDTPVMIQLRVKPHPLWSWWAFVIYFIVVFAVLITIYYFLINNYRIKHAYEIEKLERKKEDNINQFKFRFFTNISHELLTPLSVLSFSVEDLATRNVVKDETLSIMDRNVKRIMHLVSQLLDFRKVERGSMSPLVSPGNIDSFIEKISQSLKPMAAKKKIDVSMDGNVRQTIYFDHDKMEKILCNLLSNALKYTPEGGKLFINHHLFNNEGREWLQLDVTDTGKGIEPEKIDKVFERFYQVKSVTGRTFGVGIGLALAKSLVENHKGTITVKNEPGLGARFTVQIPVSPDVYEKSEISQEELEYQLKNYIIDTDESLHPEPADRPVSQLIVDEDQRKTVLIVEDNHDFRQLLKGHLSNYFHILEAENGSKGYEICLEKQPDLVITDLMMPVMDGIELCSKIKNNIETSHIIVILLTAKNSADTRYESYLAQADSFLCKPVDIRTLQTRVESLLARFEGFTRKYSSGHIPPIEDNTLSRLDEELLTKIKALVEERISETELNVMTLSQSVGMSKSNLYRKITKLTTMSPVEFIRYIRLQYSARLIVNDGLNISEAAYASGFNDLSYFSKSFKKQFGVSPKKYKQSSEFSPT